MAKKYVSDKFETTGGNNTATLDFVVGQEYSIGDSGYIGNNLYKVHTAFTFTGLIGDFAKLTQAGEGGDPIYRTMKVGDIIGGHYLEVEPDGTYVAKGEATTYRDEYPAYILPVSGAPAPDSVSHTVGGVLRQFYSFDGGNQQEVLSGSFEIPHDYKVGSPIEVHVHYRPSTALAGDVKRFFDYEYSPPQLGPQAQTTLFVVQSIAVDTQYRHRLVAFLELPDLGFSLGGKIGFNLRRTPNDVEDTYDNDVLFEQIAIHIEMDTQGSRQRYIK